MLDPDYSPEMPGRLAKLEGAISKQRTVKFEYWSISRDEASERTLNPYALLPDNGIWYVVGYDLDRDDIRTFRVSRIRGDIKFATRRERDFRAPADFDIEQYRGRPPWQIGDIVGEARIEVPGRHGLVGAARLRHRRAGSRTASSSPSTRPSRSSPRGCCARTAARCRSSRTSCGARSPRRCAACATATRASRRSRRARPPDAPPTAATERPAGPVAPERFAVLQALLAYLLAALRRGATRRRSRPPSCSSASPRSPPEELEEHLSLLNLVNFGGGCYTIYAELRDDDVHVDKELWGDTFRSRRG